MSKRKFEYKWLIVAAFLFLFFAMSVYSMSLKSITNDELTHITSGYSYLKSFDFRMNPEHPPLMKLLAGFPLLFLDPVFPTDHQSWIEGSQWVFGAQFLYFQNSNTDQLIFWARLPMVLIGMLLGFFVFLFAKDLYGDNAGFLALFLYSFSPNILAHTRLVTTDVGLACFSLMTVYFLYRYLVKDNSGSVWLAGLSFGLAMATKFSAVYLVGIGGLMALSYVYFTYLHHKKKVSPIDIFVKKGLHKAFVWVMLVGIAVTVLSYGVANFDSYIRGFLNVAYHSQSGHNSFLMGEHSSTGFLMYFPIAYLVKTPIAMLALLLLTAVFYTRINKDCKKALQRDMVLFIPIIVFVGAFIINRINIGLRHILPAFPFLFIWVSQSINVSWKKTVKVVVFSLIILAYLWASLSIAPDYLAYFNEFAGGPDDGHKFLIDSNIDWGQDLKQLGVYLKENNISTVKMAYFGKDSRAYRGINWTELRCAPQSGTIAVSVGRLVGFDKKSSYCLEWLREFRPVDSIGHSIKIYKIDEQEILVPLKAHCDTQCKKKCEDQMQIFEQSVFNESCRCTCSAII